MTVSRYVRVAPTVLSQKGDSVIPSALLDVCSSTERLGSCKSAAEGSINRNVDYTDS